MVRCENCGIELTEDHIYCPQCGNPLRAWEEDEDEDEEDEDFAIFEEEF